MSLLGNVTSIIVNIPRRICTKVSLLALLRGTVVSRKAAVAAMSRLYNSSVGDFSYIGSNCIIISTSIGKYCSISGNCIIGPAEHPMDWAATSPVFLDGANMLKENFHYHHYTCYSITHIGNDVWIGEGAYIKGGCRIGDGAVIAAKAVVTKDVEPYAIVAGVPAKLLRRRFDDKIVNKLSELKWWNLNEKLIKERLASVVNDVEKFVEVLQKIRQQENDK